MMKLLYLFILTTFLLSSCDSRKKETSDTTPPTQTPPDTVVTQPAPAAPTAPDSAFLILPGKRIGQISLGQTADKISNTLNKPDSSDAAMGKAISFWFSRQQPGEPRHMVAVYFTRNNDDGPESLYARQIRINSPAFKTSEGIGTGNKLQQIRQKYTLQPLAYFQTQQQQRVYIYDDLARGIAFEIITPDSTCTAITIHEKGENISNTYLPLHPNLVKFNQ